MDCLDRTNVVQSVFGRNILHEILGKMGIGNKTKQVGAFERLPDKLEEDFRVSWTKNADTISMLYSGTPAMKTDFTLMGKRTVKGAIMDIVYGVKRYFLGNFYDWRTQDIIDISTGKLKPKKDRIKKPLINIMFIILLLVPLVLISANRSPVPRVPRSGLAHVLPRAPPSALTYRPPPPSNGREHYPSSWQLHPPASRHRHPTEFGLDEGRSHCNCCACGDQTAADPQQVYPDEAYHFRLINI